MDVMLHVDTTETSRLASRVNLWLGQWVQDNRYWEWQPATHRGEGLLEFFQEFLEPPSCRVFGPGLLALRVTLRPNARRWWKDWLALRLLKDVRVAFKEITGIGRFLRCS
jgi:hypothetical protein